MGSPLDSAVDYYGRNGVYQLSDELDDVLSNIAFGGAACDLKYIYRKRRELKRKYDGLVNYLKRIDQFCEESPMLLALGNIRDAYFGFMTPLPSWKEMSPEEREEEAEDILGEHAFLCPEAISLSCEINRLENMAFKKGKSVEVLGWSLWPDGKYELDYEFV